MSTTVAAAGGLSRNPTVRAKLHVMQYVICITYCTVGINGSECA